MTKAPKVMVFGSCMSNLTANHLVLDYSFEQTHSIHHNRSDIFIKYYIDKTETMIPLSEIEEKFVYKKEMESEAKQFLRNQYADFIGFHDLQHNIVSGRNFFDDIREKKFDVILLDNFMDIAAKLVYWKSRPDLHSKLLFLNLGFYENEAELTPEFWHTEYLSPIESAENWIIIFDWIRSLQPSAHIYFIPYHSCSSTSVPERHERIVKFYDHFSVISKDRSLKVLPPFNVEEKLTKGQQDWPHYQPQIYKAIAGAIYLDYQAGYLSSILDCNN